MIRLFRKIRHKLLSDNSYGIYLLYASGEILLVVIGILLALQIDNWNDERKSRDQAFNLLEELYENLESDIIIYDTNIRVQENIIVSTDILIDHLENKKQYHDSLSNHFTRSRRMPEFAITSTAFESLKSVGIEKVASTQLKKDIAYHYDVRIARAVNRIDKVSTSFMETLRDYHFRNFRRDSVGLGIAPLDYKALINDPYYLNYLYDFKGHRNAVIFFNNNLKERTESLMNQIDLELKK